MFVAVLVFTVAAFALIFAFKRGIVTTLAVGLLAGAVLLVSAEGKEREALAELVGGVDVEVGVAASREEALTALDALSPDLATLGPDLQRAGGALFGLVVGVSVVTGLSSGERTALRRGFASIATGSSMFKFHTSKIILPLSVTTFSRHTGRPPNFSSSRVT